MSKKLLAAVCLLLLMLTCFLPVQAAERKLTLMIYMCGSNLESSYGSASADIQEMLAAAPGLTDATVLLMTGGSTSWSTGFDASQTQISELGKRGTRVVWRSNAMNMGDPETLTQLLQYGVEKYPAQEYALIMWNHGGGPLEGVCWDELFSMDKLTLAELTGAITAAELPHKLSWIGFDACLMSSIEVASALAPHAEYMIASQETEPAFGWNYAFLSGIAEDASGLETGRRIVDAYFAGHEDATETLTLACLDLSKVDAAASAVESFFSPAKDMNHALYTAVSGVRMNTTGFGKGLKSFDDDGYDLVDLDDLTARLSPLLSGAAELQSALDELVCYSRANIEDANGISIYHPYMNKDKYLAQWQSSYDMLAISDKYAAYVQKFGSWLTGSALAEWENLTPRQAGTDSNGKEQLALQLSPEQAAEFASAQLMIICKLSPTLNAYSLIGSVPAQIDENGLISATADWRSLYIVEESGQINGPLSYELTQDGKQMARHVYFRLDGTSFDDDMVSTWYFLEPTDNSDRATVDQIRVYDPATQTFTNRISIADLAIDSLQLFNTDYMLPEANDKGVLPAIHEWPRNDVLTSWYRVNTGTGWHFALLEDIRTDSDLYAVFSITDAQQNTYCSLPIELQNPYRTPFTASACSSVHADFDISLSGYVTSVDGGEGVVLKLDIDNQTDHESNITIDNLILNDHRLVESFSADYDNPIAPNTSATFYCFVSTNDLLSLSDIHRISFQLNYQPDPDDYSTRETVITEFAVENCSVSAITPEPVILAQAEQDGIRWTLLEITPSEYSGFNATLCVENATDEEFETGGALMIDDLRMKEAYLDIVTLPPGCSSILSMRVYNDILTTSMPGFKVSESSNFDSYVLSQHLLQSYGINEIREMTVISGSFDYRGAYDHKITLTLDTPVPLTSDLEDDVVNADRIFRLAEEDMLFPNELLTLADNAFYTVKLERIMVGNTNMVVCLHLTNNADEVQRISYSDLQINGISQNSYLTSGISLLPHSTTVFVESIGPSVFDDPLPDPAIHNFGMTFSSNLTEDKETVTLSLNEPAPFAYPGGVMLATDGLAITDAQTLIPPVVPKWEGPVALFMEEVHLPENAHQYSKTFSVQLTEEQQAQAASALMLLVREAPSGNLELIHYQRADFQDNAALSSTASGLVLCVESLPDILLDTYQSMTADGSLVLYNSMTAYSTGLSDWEYYSVFIRDIEITFDPAANTAALTNIVLDDPLPPSQTDLTTMHLPTYELSCTLADDALPYVGHISRNTDDSWVYGGFFMNDFPVQLALRPITAEDQIYVMFSVKNADGTGYTLPAIPYMTAGE